MLSPARVARAATKRRCEHGKIAVTKCRRESGIRVAATRALSTLMNCDPSEFSRLARGYDTREFVHAFKGQRQQRPVASRGSISGLTYSGMALFSEQTCVM